MNSSEQKQAILAMMHGDAYVDVNRNSGKARLDIYHCDKQLPLLLWKQSVLEGVTGIKCRVTEKVDNRPLLGGGTRKGWRLQTNFSRYLYSLHYTPTKFQVKQLVKPLALAVLWADDGTLIHTKAGAYSSALLCTDVWDESVLKQFVERFNALYGWCPVVMDYKCRGKMYKRLRLRKRMMEKLTQVVKSHTVDCMKYKLLNIEAS